MTDDEILELADRYMDGSLNFRSVAIEELLEFARVIAAKERAACAEICDRFQARDVGMQPAECAGAIRARGE